MNWHNLLPLPDTLPASWWLFESLGVLTFTVHILFINVVVGTSLLALIKRFRSPDSPGLPGGILDSSANKIPSLIALAVTIGVAPLLFLQVLYGTLAYSSSVLMATFWILVIPVLIFGYYGAYLYAHKRRQGKGRSSLATLGLVVLVAALLYIGFMLTNNMTLMLNPEKWPAYFQHRSGFILNLDDVTVYMRYFHFLTASVGVAGLFSAIVWHYRKHTAGATEKTRAGLRLFGFATMAQVLVGILLLLAIPSDYMRQFMGRNMAYTLVLMVGMATGVAVIITAMRGKLWTTVWLLVITTLSMGTLRAMLRAAYLEHFFDVSSVAVNTQYSPMIAFVIILIIGLAVVAWMIKAAANAQQRRVAQ